MNKIRVLLVDDHALFRGGVKSLLQTLRSGATSYLLKNIEADILVNAIRMAATGESVISPLMMSKLLGCSSPPAPPPPPPPPPAPAAAQTSPRWGGGTALRLRRA